ncbi:MAG: DUF5678 domain-containing protein, partial [Thermoplasmatales archaeon]|nr:DUF5678 domain-containing protein [Thermoplasmatales archaeon]
AFAEYDRNLRWAKANAAKLHRYDGEFVAVHGQKVIAHGTSQEEVENLAEGNAGVYVTLIAPPGLAWIL